MIEGTGKPGCTVILATPAKEDWDLPKFRPYKKLFDEVLPHCRDPYEILDRYADEYAHQPEFIHNYRFCHSHHPALPIFAAFPLRRLNYAGRLFIAGAENPEMIKRLGMRPFPSVEKAVAAAREIHGKDSAVAFTKYPPNFIHKPPRFSGMRIEKVLPLRREFATMDQNGSKPVAYDR